MMELADGSMITAAEIASVDGLNNVGSIAEVEGLRLIMINRGALTRSLGCRIDSPEFAAAERRILDAAAAHGVAVGTWMSSRVPEGDTVLKRQARLRARALALSEVGYDHVVIGDPKNAIRAALRNFAAPAAEGQGPVQRDASIEAPPARENSGRRRLVDYLKEGVLTIASFLMHRDLKAARLLAPEYGAVWLDGEHGEFTVDDMVALITALHGRTDSTSGGYVNVIARVGGYDDPEIGRLIEAGADAIVAPSIQNAEQARTFVETVTSHRPEEVAAIVMIESFEGWQNRDAILSVPGIAAVHVGPADMAKSLRRNIPEFEGRSVKEIQASDRYKQILADVEEAARRAGVPLGGAALSRAAAYEENYPLGYRLLTGPSNLESVHRFADGWTDPASAGVQVLGPENTPEVIELVGPTIIRADAGWQEREPGTLVKTIHVDGATIQIVKKSGDSHVGVEWDDRHRQGQFSLLTEGTATMKYGDQETEYAVTPGDGVWIPSNGRHRFTDKTPDFTVIDIFRPDRLAPLYRPGAQP
jgi:4-hydroxy-2-oxoheptanedioate aldolase